MIIKTVLLIAFFSVLISIGLYCRRHSTDVNGLFWEAAQSDPGSPPSPTAHRIFPQSSL